MEKGIEMTGIDGLVNEFMVAANAMPHDEKLSAFRLVRVEIEREISAMKRKLAEQLDQLNLVLAPADLLTVSERVIPAKKKYVNPDDPSQSWAGVGRRPEWFIDAVKAGIDPAELEIAS